mmetsp:Transcript_105368/g.267773  ORF Transcript_105368/g.267773 Transcript_105368/m.267773 type:complete len:263 (-) Transcript_105368:35-823(-)
MPALPNSEPLLRMTQRSPSVAPVSLQWLASAPSGAPSWAPLCSTSWMALWTLTWAWASAPSWASSSASSWPSASTASRRFSFARAGPRGGRTPSEVAMRGGRRPDHGWIWKNSTSSPAARFCRRRGRREECRAAASACRLGSVRSGGREAARTPRQIGGCARRCRPPTASSARCPHTRSRPKSSRTHRPSTGLAPSALRSSAEGRTSGHCLASTVSMSLASTNGSAGTAVAPSASTVSTRTSLCNLSEPREVSHACSAFQGA